MIGQHSKQITIIDYYYMYVLDWEPGAAQDTLSYFHRLPALGRKSRFQLCFYYEKVYHLCGSPEFPYQNLGQIGQGVHE